MKSILNYAQPNLVPYLRTSIRRNFHVELIRSKRISVVLVSIIRFWFKNGQIGHQYLKIVTDAFRLQHDFGNIRRQHRCSKSKPESLHVNDWCM